jgi:tetratricopeptide (TPR) repeat protein/predicted Ser/Thr protein kinase
MECPQCQTPNPPNATRCEHCECQLSLEGSTLADSPMLDGDLNRTIDNWSAPVTFPSPGEAAAAGELQIGSLLANRYEILTILGVGGMGTVYKARDQEVDRLVAVKVIRAELAGNADILTRFRQELVLARKVTHKNVIRIFDLGRVSGLRYITMEYIDGQDLRSYVKKKGKLTPQECVEVMQPVCLALEAAHNEKVVHRDLKPQNIMIDAEDKIYVMDFGIARSVGAEGLTMTGGYVGTPGYMSPEQVKGDEVDGRSDIFTMGIILYELLTNKMPYSAETVQRSMYKRTVERSASVISIDPAIPKYLSEVVAKCLEIDPQERYQNAHELWTDLETWHAGETNATSLVVRRHVRQAFGKPTIPIAAAVVLLVVLGIVLARRWTGTSGVAKTEAAVIPSRALAVFPFRNASGDPKLDWLGASLGEMLTNDIGQSASLRTISEERVSQVLHDLRIAPDARIEPATIDQLTQFTNADVVVSGEFAKFGDEVRIDATITDRKNGTQIPVKAQAASEKDVLKAVDALAGQIRRNLALSSSAIGELETTAFKPSSSSIEALRDFARGEQLQRLGKNLDATEAFKSSIGHDPDFALAYSKLSETLAEAHQDDQAQSASLKAVELSATLPKQEKYLIAATHADILKQYPKAIESYEALAKASPGNTDVLLHLASLYGKSGTVILELATLEKVRTLDPKNAAVLLALGRAELDSNNAQKGLEDLNSALNLAIQAGNDEQKADVLQAIGVGYEGLQRPDDALQKYRESLDIKRRVGMKSGIAASLDAIANLESSMGNPDPALKNFQESLKIRREIGDKAGIGDVLNDLAGFYEDHGQAEQALKLYKESLQIQIDLGTEQTRALLLNNIGNIYLGQGNYQDAQTYYEQALQLREKFNVPADIAETRHNIGETATDLGMYDKALDQYHQALDLQRKAGNKQMAAYETSSLGTVFGYQGRYGAALSANEEAMKTFRELGERSLRTVTIGECYGLALAQVGKHAEADQALADALTLARELKNPDEIARIQGLQGDNAYYRGDLKAARQAYADALKSAAKSADVRLTLTAKFNVAKMDVAEAHPQAALPKLSAVTNDASKAGFKYLSVLSAIYQAKALIEMKDFARAAETLQSVLVQTEKLGLGALRAQGYALLAVAQRGQGKGLEAQRASSTAEQLFGEITAESHLDLRTRPDVASLLGAP